MPRPSASRPLTARPPASRPPGAPPRFQTIPPQTVLTQPILPQQIVYRRADGAPTDGAPTDEWATDEWATEERATDEPLIRMHRAPSPRRTRGPRWLVRLGVLSAIMVLGFVGTVLLLGFGASAVSGTTGTNDHAGAADVTLGECVIDPATGFMTAAVTITNHGTNQASYLIDVSFRGVTAQTPAQSSVASAVGVSAGESTTAVAAAPRGQRGRFTCAITNVTRI